MEKNSIYIVLQGRDVGDSRMNVRPVQGAEADDVESTGMRIRAEDESSDLETRYRQPSEEASSSPS